MSAQADRGRVRRGLPRWARALCATVATLAALGLAFGAGWATHAVTDPHPDDAPRVDALLVLYSQPRVYDAAIELATALLNGETPKADQELEDGTPYIAVTPQLVGPEQVTDVVDAGDADATELCAGEVAAACEKYGISG